MTTTTTHRRTVAEMQARLDRARDLIEKRAAEERAESERLGSPDGTFSHGAAVGFECALQVLDWAFSPEQDWMFRP